MTHTASLSWFARHELMLAWRDWTALMSGGRRLKDHVVTLGMVVFALGLHGLAYAVLSPFFAAGASLDSATLVAVSGCIVLTFTMMMSQAMESVTRAFYSRDDLDLILSSPASARDLFAIRITAMVVTTASMSGLMVAPFINVAALLGGAQWLAAYVVILALAALATGCAVLLTLFLFRTVGAKRARLVAQIMAAVVGASFLIGIQIVAILSYGTMSRFAVFNSDWVVSNAPLADSMYWIPAFAVSGNTTALAVVVVIAIGFFAFVVNVGSSRFQEHVVSALGVFEGPVRRSRVRRGFKHTSTHYALLNKEWMLLGRDPWLISQTLMQVLYLIPPALMLWVSFGATSHVQAILAPVLVMAIGQLAGGLAWLTISGEDAPDLVATAPLSGRTLILAKVEAVLAVVCAIAAPLVLALAFVSAWGALVTLCGVLVAASSAILIQLWFRAQAKRSNFRRRQVASKASTFCEAFASILWAGTTALAVSGSWLALMPGVLAVCVMVVAWFISPRSA